MKIFHIADLHLGKRVNEISMIDDQRYILAQISKQISIEKPDALIIAGDIYDRTIPSQEAVTLLDEFLVSLEETKVPLFIISGNHDSSERLSFASKIMRKRHIFIEGEYNGKLFKESLTVGSQTVNFFMLPFIRPFDVKPFFDFEINSYDEAVNAVINHEQIETHGVNILVAHQFVTHRGKGPELSESETTSLGGIDNVDTSNFAVFDYVALGHIHRPQRVGRDTIRYAGSPLMYSQSEINYPKSITVLDINNDEIEIRTLPLEPKRKMLAIEGKIDDLLSVINEPSDHYYFITLTDEEDLQDVAARLRVKYPNLMNIIFKNMRTQATEINIPSLESLDELNPLELFREFFILQNNQPMTDKQQKMIDKIIKVEIS